MPCDQSAFARSAASSNDLIPFWAEIARAPLIPRFCARSGCRTRSAHRSGSCRRRHPPLGRNRIQCGMLLAPTHRPDQKSGNSGNAAIVGRFPGSSAQYGCSAARSQPASAQIDMTDAERWRRSAKVWSRQTTASQTIMHAMQKKNIGNGSIRPHVPRASISQQ
jgi:hypothetical protein